MLLTVTQFIIFSREEYHSFDHNKRRKSIESKTGESINSDGIPVCSCGHTMTYDGYDRTRYRKKYRCPLKTGLIDSCPFVQTYSTSDYGRVVYVKDKDNEPRFKGPISYGSLNGNLFTKIVPALKESTMQY